MAIPTRVERVLVSGRSLRVILGRCAELARLVITESEQGYTGMAAENARLLLNIIEGGTDEYDHAQRALPVTVPIKSRNT